MHKLKRFALERKIMFIRVSAIALPLIVALLLLSQTVFAQTTYVITDGGRVLVHTTSATNPEDVLGEAGLELGADDTYTTQLQSGISEITIRRSQAITIDYYGEQVEATSFGETVEQLLTRLNLSWASNDTISLPLDTETFNGMMLEVTSVVQQNQTYTAKVAHETIYCQDPDLPAGTRMVLTPGVDGEMICNATVTYRNGIETQRTIISCDVVSQPVDEVVALGCGTVDPEAVTSQMPIIDEDTITLPTGEVLTYTGVRTMVATAYHCEGYVGTTALGTVARVGAIAVDPDVIPYGTRMFIISSDGQYIYGIATAEDCGDKRFIVGNRLDLFYNTRYECVQFGVRDCLVYFLG